MKTPEPPRAYLPKLVEPLLAEEKDEKRVPRYVEAPALREHGYGPRNLFWGVVAILFALALLVAALLLAGPQAIVFFATALLTFTGLFVLARMHVFRQRNGGFLALALVCLFGAAIPLADTGFQALKRLAARVSAPAPIAVAPVVEEVVPLLMPSFALGKPDATGKQVKVTKDSRVVVGDRPFLIKAGDLFPFVEARSGETTFAVRDLRVSLPSNVVEVLDPNALAKGVSGGRAAPPEPIPTEPPSLSAPTADDLVALTQSAQREAIRRYPALGIRDSLENAVFVSTYQQLKQSGSAEFFSNPEWPIELAELLAKRESWARGGNPMTTGPAPVLDAPSDPRNDPPLDTLDAGAGLPSPRRNFR